MKKSIIKTGILVCGVVAITMSAFAKNKIHSINQNNNYKTHYVHATIADVDPKDIVNKYIQAIGGKDNIDKIKTIHETGNMSVQGQNLPFELKKSTPNKLFISVSMNGQVVSKQIFDGTKGYKEQMGNKTDFTDEELKKYNNEKGIFPQEFYATGDYKLTFKGITKVSDKPAYTIQVVSPAGETSTEYYDSVSYLLVRQDATLGDLEITSLFDNYKTVGNILFPYKLTQIASTEQGDMNIDFVADTVTVNEGVSDDDFK